MTDIHPSSLGGLEHKSGGGGGGIDDDEDVMTTMMMSSSEEESHHQNAQMSTSSSSPFTPNHHQGEEQQAQVIIPLTDIDDEQQQVVVVTPIPKGGLLSVVVLFICEGFAFTFLFPFVGFMIIDFGLVKDERDAGYYAGMLAGSYSAAQFFSGFIFGILSDRISKRIIVMVSTLGSMITIILFGMSGNLYYAILFRGLNGGLNGSLATAKAYLAEITDATNQSLAFSFIGLSWGIGAIGGPSIGGFLSRPAEKYPYIFGNMRLFIKYPYLLPCMFTASVMAFGFIFCAIFMVPANNGRLHDEEEEEGEGDKTTQDVVELSESTDGGDLPTTSPPSMLRDRSMQIEQMDEIIEPTEPAVKRPLLARIWDRFRLELRELIAIYKNLDVVVCTGLYFIIALSDTFQEELFPLWALIDRKKGGLGFKTTQIGIVQMIIGALMIVEPFIYPKVCQMLTKLNSTRIGFCLYALLIFTPLLNNLANVSQVAMGFGLACYTIMRASTEMFGFTSVFILMNNSSPVGAAGRVQSLSHSVGNIARAIAPVIAGPCLAVSSRLAETKSRLFMHVPFFILTVLAGIAISLTFMLNKSINEPQKRKLRA